MAYENTERRGRENAVIWSGRLEDETISESVDADCLGDASGGGAPDGGRKGGRGTKTVVPADFR